MPKEWYLMDTSTYFSGDELNNFNNYAREGFNELLNMSPEAETVLINGNEKRVIMQNTMTENINLISLRYMLSHIGDSKEGYYVDFRGHKWLVLAVPDNNKMYEKSIIQRCNHNFKWISKNNQLIIRPCIEDTRTLYTTGVREEKIWEIPNGMVGIQLPDDEDTRLLDRGCTFILNKTKYKVTFYDHTTHSGLVVLICSEVPTEITDRDDMENEIADRWIIVNGKKVDRLEAKPEPPEPTPSDVVYSIAAQTVYPDDPDDEVYWGDTVTYTVNKYINDVKVNGNFTFEVYQKSGENWTQPLTVVEVASVSNDSIGIQAINYKQGTIKLVVTDTETNKATIEKIIKIVGMMG